jgi:hypothetical protein
VTRMLAYCDDASHCANPLGPIITDPNPVLPDDVYNAGEFWDIFADGSWHSRGYRKVRRAGNRRTGHRMLSVDGQERGLLDDGTVLPTPAHRTYTQKFAELSGEARGKWSPRCEWCDQRGGRWKVEDRDEVFSQLARRGVTGVSLRALDLIKHSGIRSI